MRNSYISADPYIKFYVPLSSTAAAILLRPSSSELAARARAHTSSAPSSEDEEADEGEAAPKLLIAAQSARVATR